MRKKFLVFSLVISFISLIIFCMAAYAKAEEAGMYSVLLAKLKSGDTSVDYRILRMETLRALDYNPYSNDGDKREIMSRAFSGKKYDEALTAAGGNSGKKLCGSGKPSCEQAGIQGDLAIMY